MKTYCVELTDNVLVGAGEAYSSRNTGFSLP
jgi:hypothetical protein